MLFKEAEGNVEAFAAHIFALLVAKGITPILYGSYLFNHYTGKNAPVNDIDAFIPEAEMEKAYTTLKGRWQVVWDRHWHTIIVESENGKVELDSYEYWCKERQPPIPFDFYGIGILALSREALRVQYEYAAEHSGDGAKREAYKKKAELL